jgi:ubiquinone/menaquinone biosynthesis C-methylase UbiE
MASTYGYINLISSFGFTARWRRQAVAGLPLASAGCVVDLMSGMGELWRSLAAALPASAQVIGVDISPEMAHRTHRKWHFPVEVRVADVLEWDTRSAFADVVVSSFGLKTFDGEQQRRLAFIVARLLKDGGSFSFVEISVPSFRPLRAVYMFYLKWLIPMLGRLLLGNPESYRMLGAYTECFENAAHFASCLRQAGLEVVPVSYFFGCATGARGYKPTVEAACPTAVAAHLALVGQAVPPAIPVPPNPAW